MLLGIKAVMAESFERIHRSNLVGMGVLPLQFQGDMTRKTPRPRRRRKSSTSTGLAAGKPATSSRAWM